MTVENEVVTEVTSLRDFWLHRTNKIKEWYKLRYMDDVYQQKNYESVVMNDPKTLFNLSQYMLSAIPARHKIPLASEDESQRKLIGKSERALVSLWREVDSRLMRSGRRPWRWEFADFVLITGWYAVFAAVLKNDDGSPKFIADVWNPANTFQEWDDEGLSRCAQVYSVSLTNAKRLCSKFGWPMPEALNVPSISSNVSVEVINYWKRQGGEVLNGVMFDKKFVKGLQSEDFDEIPILTGPAAGEASWGGYGLGDSNWTQRYGESILEPNAEIYNYQNRNMSFIMQILRDNAQPPIIDKNAGARALIKPEDVVSGAIIHTELDQEVGPMRQIRLQEELNVAQSIFSQQVQQGGFPYTLFGAVPSTLDLSGFAIGLLMTAAQNVIGSYKEAMTFVLQEIDRVWLEEYKRGEYEAITISGRMRGGETASLFHEDYSPEDVPDCTYIDVTVPLATPSDLVQKMAIARQAKPIGDILDVTTILDEILDIQDPALVQKRLDESRFEESQPMIVLKMVLEAKEKERKFREEGEEQYAEILAMFSSQLMGSLGAPPPGSPSPAQPGVSPAAGREGTRGVPATLSRQIAGAPSPQRVAEEEGR